LDDACWQTAPASEFVKFVGNDLVKELYVGATAKVCYDAANLYIGVELMEPAIGELNKRFTQRDDPIWGDDCVEVFIAPDYTAPKRYVHLAVNPINTQTDQQSRGMRGFDQSWNGDWTSAAAIGKDRWVVEMRVPWTDMGVRDIAAVDLMGVSVCRERKAGKPEYSAWAVGGAFHKPSGHVLLTSYERFVERTVLPQWRKERTLIVAAVADNAVSQAHREALRAVLERTDKAIAGHRKALNAEAVEAIIAAVKQAVTETGALKRDVRFSMFMARLREAVAH